MRTNPNMPSVYTIIFTEKCGLKCIFCDMYAQPSYLGGRVMEKEVLFRVVDEIVSTHRAAKTNPLRLLFSGGEPFLHWSWIREIFLKYGTSIQYGFNTSGYDLTKEMLEFMSGYQVYFTLSVCGDEQISKWQRPTVNGQFDYWEKVSKIFPTLLYYFPETAWKSILSRRMIPFVHRLWSAAERMGFRYIQFVPDFGDQERSYTLPQGGVLRKVLNEPWHAEDFDKLLEQYSLICQDFAAGICEGKIRTLDREMQHILFSLFNRQAADLACGVSAGRGGYTIYAERTSSSCLTRIAREKKVEINELINSLSPPEKCPREGDCPYWAACIKHGCVKDNYEEQGDFFKRTDLGCKLTKIAGDAVVNMLDFLNEVAPPFYPQFIQYLSRNGGFPWRHIHPV